MNYLDIGKGFDVVLGNPPYVSTKGTSDDTKKHLQAEFGFADDLYSHFYFKGFSCLIQGGVIAFITSKTFWTIQTKKNLRELLLKNNILAIYDTDSPFDSAMVDTCIVIARRDEYQHELIKFLKATDDYGTPKQTLIEKEIYADAVNSVFFNPTKFNVKISAAYNEQVKALMTKWWDKFNTSRNISKHEIELAEYRKSLNAGDITLLGLITDGGVGLQTGNNGRYVGVLEGTKEAERVKETRPDKLFKANLKELRLDNKNQAVDCLAGKTEFEVRDLFDDLKEKHGRDIFGQGYLFRVVGLNEVADLGSLTDDEKANGIKGKRTFVPYDKGDKDGNRWYLQTPYYIDWSYDNVRFLKKDPKARYQGYQFYFREGFCWSDIHTVLIKTRLKDTSVHDVKSMSMFSYSEKCSDKYIVSVMNSTFISNYDFTFVNSTQTFQINDARQLPIIIPTGDELKEFEGLFDSAYQIKKKQFGKEITKEEAFSKLNNIQIALDRMVYQLYGLTADEIEIIEAATASKKKEDKL